MRPVFFCLVSLLLVQASPAQIQKHTRFIGASMAAGSFSSGTTEFSYASAQGYKQVQTNHNFSITPSYGVFISDKTCIGGSFLLSYGNVRIENRTMQDTVYKQDKSNSLDLGLGVFLRQYFSTGRSLMPFVQLYVNGGTGSGKSSGFNYSTDQFGDFKDVYSGKTSGKFFLNSGLNIGLTKMLAQTVGIDVFAGYMYSYTRFSSSTEVNRDYSNAQPDLLMKYEPTQKFTGNGLNIGIGLQFFLPAKR